MSVSSTSLNLSGLSGYDFSAIIDKMVTVYKIPEARMEDQKTELTTQKAAWQEINTKLAAVDTALDALKKSTTWTSTTATTPASNTFFSVSSSGSGVQGTYNVNISKTAKSETDVSKELTDSSLAAAMDAALGTTYSDDGTSSNWDFSLTVNGTTKTVHVVKSSTTGTDPTLQDVVNSINSSGAGAKASLIQTSSGNYRIALNSSQTGEANAITFGDPNNFLKTIGVLNAGGTVSDYSATGLSDSTLGGKIQSAQDANLTVNGLSITSATNTVSTAIQGVTLTLSAAGASTVTVGADSSAALKAVKSFVDAYNSAQDLIAKDLAYDADTKTAGALLGDSMLMSIQSTLREKIGSELGSGAYSFLSEIGISTSNADFGKSATLVLDETKFTGALAADPQSVANLFSASYNGYAPGTDEGLASVMSSYLDPITKYGGVIANKTTSYTDQIKYITDRIADFEERATAYEESLKLKFATLEATLSGMNSQMSWLTAQTSALSSND